MQSTSVPRHRGLNEKFPPGGAVQYPLLNCDCRPVNVCAIRTRTRYAVRVETTATGGVFRMLGRGCCAPNNNLASINGTAPTSSTTPAA